MRPVVPSTVARGMRLFQDDAGPILYEICRQEPELGLVWARRTTLSLILQQSTRLSSCTRMDDGKNNRASDSGRHQLTKA